MASETEAAEVEPATHATHAVSDEVVQAFVTLPAPHGAPPFTRSGSVQAWHVAIVAAPGPVDHVLAAHCVQLASPAAA